MPFDGDLHCPVPAGSNRRESTHSCRKAADRPRPANNGSALAELFNDPERGEAIINRLTGVFVPEGFDPSSDLMVQDVRPEAGDTQSPYSRPPS